MILRSSEEAARVVRRARRIYRVKRAFKAASRIVGAIALCLVALAFTGWSCSLALRGGP